MGAAKTPASAMDGNPCLATVVSATRSPTLPPRERPTRQCRIGPPTTRARGGLEGVRRGSRGGLEGKKRSSVDAREPQNPTKSEEYR
eukprot:600190-Prorocentrum_minimum.AAC.1